MFAGLRVRPLSMMVALSLAVGTVLTGGVAEAAPGEVVWTRQFGTSSSDVAWAVAAAADGSIHLAGYTWGDLAGPNAGGADAFVRKYDADGNVVWTRQFGSSADDFALAAAAGPDGSAHVAGYTWGDLEGSSLGERDAFVRKYDADGNVVWTRQFGTSASDFARGVAVVADGSVYVAGDTYGDLEDSSLGVRDAFVRKYDADGNVVWTRQFGTSDSEVARGVAVAADGSVYVAGWTGGDLEGASAGGADAFVRKYDADGNVVWTRQFGTSTFEYAAGVAVADDGSVYVAVYTQWSHFYRASVRKYDADGGVVWTRQFSIGTSDVTAGVAAAADGSVYVAGYTWGSSGPSDAFVHKYDAAGEAVWTRQFGTSASDFARGVAVAGDGSAYVAGSTSGHLEGTNAGDSDAFVRKYADHPITFFNVPGDIEVEAEGPTTVVVFDEPTAESLLDGPIPVECVPGSGSGFAKGVTEVVCSAEDSVDNSRTTSLAVTVMDTTPPVISGMPGWIEVEATEPSGAVVTWEAPTATDVVDGPVPVVCVPGSGWLFPVGDTTVECSAMDSEGNTATGSFEVFVLEPPLTWEPDSSPSVVRYAGADRFATAVRVSENHFPDPGAVSVVFVAVGSNFPDALAGAAVAGRLGAPLLLVATDSIPAVTAAELQRLGPNEIVILGGEAVISPAVAAALGGYGTVIRLAGANRYATAVAISKWAFGDPGAVDEVVVATGANFPDALGGGPVGVAVGGPVLLVPATGPVPQVVKEEIVRLGPARITVLGGSGAVSDAVVAELNALAPTNRVAGANRYATAIEASKHGFDAAGRVYVAVGTNFPDALAGAAVAGFYDAPVLLVPSHALPEAVAAEIIRLGAHIVIILGGTSVVSNDVEDALRTLLGAF